jgi:hypothetical protein
MTARLQPKYTTQFERTRLKKSAANFRCTQGRDSCQKTSLSSPTNMGWRGVRETDLHRFHLPVRRRYRIIVKSGKDIQPIFINRFRPHCHRRMGFDQRRSVS